MSYNIIHGLVLGSSIEKGFYSKETQNFQTKFSDQGANCLTRISITIPFVNW